MTSSSTSQSLSLWLAQSVYRGLTTDYPESEYSPESRGEEFLKVAQVILGRCPWKSIDDLDEITPKELLSLVRPLLSSRHEMFHEEPVQAILEFAKKNAKDLIRADKKYSSGTSSRKRRRID